MLLHVATLSMFLIFSYGDTLHGKSPARRSQKSFTISKMVETCQINIRLLPSANRALREFIHQKGDLQNHILQIFESIDLNDVKIPDMRAENEDGTRLASTSITEFPAKYHTRMQKIARQRGCTMSALLNGGVIEYSKMLRKQKRNKSTTNFTSM